MRYQKKAFTQFNELIFSDPEKVYAIITRYLFIKRFYVGFIFRVTFQQYKRRFSGTRDLWLERLEVNVLKYKMFVDKMVK